MKTDKKKGVKILLTVLAAVAALLVVFSLVVQFAFVPDEAANVTRDYTIVTRDVEGASGHPDVLDTLQEDGVEYVRDDDAAEPVVETIETRPIYEITQEFEALPNEQAPVKHEITINGKPYVLDLVEAEYEPVTRERETLSETVVFEGVTSEPAVDSTLPITYASSTGQELTVEGELESLDKTREYWSTYTVKNGTVRLPAGANGFIYNGKIITYNADSPKWDGWKEDVMAVEGLKSGSVQLSDIVWVGSPYDVGGVMHRDLKITGKRLLQDWTATYVSKGEKTTAYNAVALYSGYTDEVGIPEELATDIEYLLNVSVRYSMVSTANTSAFTQTLTENRSMMPLVCIIGSVVLLVCLVLLLLVRRMQSADEEDYDDGLDDYLDEPSSGYGRDTRPKSEPRTYVIDGSDSYITEVRNEGVDPPSDPFGEDEP